MQRDGGSMDLSIFKRRLPKRTRTVHLVAFNTGAQFAGRGAAALIGLVQVGILSHYLHSTGYGRYVYVLSVIGFAGLLTDMGIGNVSIRLLNQATEAERPTALQGIFTARAILAVIAVVATVLFALIAPLDTSERQGIAMMSAIYILTIPGAVSGLFEAALDLHIVTAVSVAQSAVGLIITSVLVASHATLLPLLATQLFTAAVGSIVLYMISTRRYTASLGSNARSGIRIVLQALPIGMTTALNIVYLRIDAILLGLMRGAADVAHYAAATRFIDLATFGSTALAASLYPVMARMSSETHRPTLRRAYQTCTDIMLFAGIPLAIGWFLLAQPMISLVYPADMQSAVLALRILSWVLIPLFVNSVVGSLVLTLHLERKFLWLSVSAAMLNVALNIVFIPSYGIVASSIITVVSELFVTLIAVYLIFGKIDYIPTPRFGLLTLLSALAMAIPVYLLRGYWPAAVLGGGIIFFLVSRSLGLWTPERLRSWFV
jgi:O-antigen/teichoic acid export membrane protein